jgi:hypothetical protein
VHAEGDRVILRRAGGARHEVELVAPETSPVAGDATAAGATAAGATADAAAELPPPICPQGSPSGDVCEDGDGPEPAPGRSPLDEVMDKLPQVRRADDFASDDAHSDRTGGER